MDSFMRNCNKKNRYFFLFRLHFDSSGGAWCPSRTVSKETVEVEWIEVDLGEMHVVTHVLTQGRFGNGRGQEYAEAYTIQYWRPQMQDFKDYRDSMGRAVSHPKV